MTPAQERVQAMGKARELYIKTGEETNITVAFERYLLEHPLEPRHPVRISKKDVNYIKPSIISEENRPKCPDCDKPMKLGHLNTSKKNQVGGDFRSQWVCPDEGGCGYQSEYSTLTVEEQIRKYDNN